MKHIFVIDTPLSTVKATWERQGRMIEVRYGDRVKRAQASETDATNLFVARNIVQGWIDDDMKEDD